MAMVNISIDRNQSLIIMDCDKSQLLPSYAYYILDYQQCTKLKFKKEPKIYEKENLKGKEKWKDVK
jgi:hypothetical protein